MNARFYIGLLTVGFMLGGGCDVSHLPVPTERSNIEGIKLSDLQADNDSGNETTLRFSVLVYALDITSLDAFEDVFQILSSRQVRVADPKAFEANCFAAGFGVHRKGGEVARKLSEIGAVRISQKTLIFPAGGREVVYQTPIDEPRPVLYSTSTGGLGGVTVEKGRLGWVLSAGQDPALRGVVEMTVAPAFWDSAGAVFRLRKGKEPYEFRYFDVGRIRVPLEAGQFCLLGPTHILDQENALNRLLFEVSGQNKIRFFVIICESTGN